MRSEDRCPSPPPDRDFPPPEHDMPPPDEMRSPGGRFRGPLAAGGEYYSYLLLLSSPLMTYIQYKLKSLTYLLTEIVYR
jgi:hypothetical protein